MSNSDLVTSVPEAQLDTDEPVELSLFNGLTAVANIYNKT